ncbi:MAG TPA: hypothetical protein VFD74_03750, partial [Thermoleophilia bacterium]|nr:hypothetical protein [Thermoleophilia bacterium]
CWGVGCGGVIAPGSISSGGVCAFSFIVLLAFLPSPSADDTSPDRAVFHHGRAKVVLPAGLR